MNGIYKTVTGVFFFTIRAGGKSCYKGGYATFEEAEIDKEMYYWARDKMKRKRQEKGRRKYREHRV